MPNDQQAILSRDDVRIVVLVEAVARAVVHALRFGIGALLSWMVHTVLSCRCVRMRHCGSAWRWDSRDRRDCGRGPLCPEGHL